MDDGPAGRRTQRGRKVLWTAPLVAVVAAGILLATRPDESPPTAAPPVTTPTTVVAPTSAPTTTSTSTTEAPTTTTTTVAPLPPPRPLPPRFPTQVATSPPKATVRVWSNPGGYVTQSLAAPRPFSNAPVVFAVEENPGTGWLRAALPERPNESSGWISVKDVQISGHNWSIDIDLAARYITVFDGPTIFLQAPVVIGTDATPTPEGRFYTTEAVKETNPGGSYGPYVIGLSAHSAVYQSFGAGDGQVGIHGTNQPWFLGSAVSNGCIRLNNADITKLFGKLPMGVPVTVHRGLGPGAT